MRKISLLLENMLLTTVNNMGSIAMDNEDYNMKKERMLC